MQIKEIKYPDFFKDDLNYLNGQFPNGVEFDESDFSVNFTDSFPPKVSVAVNYFHLVCGFNKVFNSLNIVLEEFHFLPNRDFDDLSSYTARYHLFTRTFFVELLKIRDIWGVFLKRLQNDRLIDKIERRTVRKMFNDYVSDLYLIRNVYLHAENPPNSKEEGELSFLITLQKRGFEPILKKIESGKKNTFDGILNSLCQKRIDAFSKVGSDVREFLDLLVKNNSQVSYNKVRMNIRAAARNSTIEVST